jgi:hypothetical protein
MPILFAVMCDETNALPLTKNSLTNPLLCRESQAEPRSLPDDPRPEAERLRDEVGFEQALADWIIKHRCNWRKARA